MGMGGACSRSCVSAVVSSKRVDIDKATLEAPNEISKKVGHLSCVVWFDNWPLKKSHSDPLVSRPSIGIPVLTLFYKKQYQERLGRHTLAFGHGQIQRGVPCY